MEEGFTYFQTKFEEDTKRWQEDGKNDIDEGSCAHFLYFEFKLEGRKKERKKVLLKDALLYTLLLFLLGMNMIKLKDNVL